MSRRAAVAGLGVSSAALILTVLVLIGPSLPGPSVRSWLGIGEPDLPVPCEFDPAKVYRPAGQPGAGSWREESASPSPSPELGAVRVGRFVYLVGGQTPYGADKTILRFDPRRSEYERVGELPVALDHPTVTAHDGEVIVAGGYVDGADSTARVFAFSPHTGRTRQLPPMRFPRGAAAAAVADDRLYVAGGVLGFGNDNRPRASMEVYDFKTERWREGPDMPTARHHFGAAAIDGKIYFAGGRTPEDLSLDALERFDPATGQWLSLEPMPVGAGSLGVVAARNRLVVTGGGEDGLQLGEGKWVLRTSYAYDPTSGRWTRLADMRRPRHGHATAAVGGRVYVFRGIPCPDYGRMAAAESLEVE